MKTALQWIMLNPAAFKSSLLALLPLIARGILAATGKIEDLGPWAGFVEMAVDLLVGCLTMYGFGGVVVHVARGPQLSSTDQTVAIVAALAPASVPVAAEVMKTIVETVATHPKATQSDTNPSPTPGPFQF